MCSSVCHPVGPKTRDSTNAFSGLQRDSDSDIVGAKTRGRVHICGTASKCPRHGLMSARSSEQLQDLYGLLKIHKSQARMIGDSEFWQHVCNIHNSRMDSPRIDQRKRWAHIRAAGGALPRFEDRPPFASKKRRRQADDPSTWKERERRHSPLQIWFLECFLNRVSISVDFGVQRDCSLHDTEIGTGDGKNAVRGRGQQMPGPGVAKPNWRQPSIDNRKLRLPTP
jgi:hypothetical protein